MSECSRAPGKATTIFFPLLGVGSEDNLSGATLAAGDFKISKDGATPVNPTTTTPTEVGATGVYGLPLTADESSGVRRLIMVANDAAGGEWKQQTMILDFEIHDRIDRNADLIESHRGAHTVQGDHYYVDPVNGGLLAAGFDGTSSKPLSTVTEALTLVVDSQHDVIFLIAGAAAGVTTLTDAATVNKRYVQIRGPGRDFIWDRSTPGDTITVTADGVGLSGFQVETASSGAGRGITVNGADFVRAEKIWFNDTQGDGMRVIDGSHVFVSGCWFEESGQSGAGHGLVLDPTGGSVYHAVVEDNHFSAVAGDSVRIGSGTVDDCVIRRNEIHQSEGWGINILGGNNAMVIGNRLHDNASGDINDSGTDTAKLDNFDSNDSSDTWNQLLLGSTYNIVNSAGRIIRELKQGAIIHEGQAQAGSLTTITLAGTASAVDNFYNCYRVTIVGGTGVGQSRMIYDYVGTTKVAGVIAGWLIAPDATSEYSIAPAMVHSEVSANCLHTGYAQAGGDNTITLASDASAVADYYNGQVVALHHNGTSAAGQARKVIDYDGTTKIATVDSNWRTNPAVDTVYSVTSQRPSGNAGPSQVTITVRDDSTLAPTEGAEVAIYDSTNTYQLRIDTTNSSGKVVFNLDDITYEARVTSPLYTYPSPFEFTVSGDGAEIFEGTAYAIPTASAPDKCVMSGTYRDGSGTAISGATVEAYAVTQQIVGGAVLGSLIKSTTANSIGAWAIEMQQLATIRIVIHGPGEPYDHIGIVPALAGQDVATWA